MFGFIASLNKLWLYVAVLAMTGALYWFITDAAYDRGVSDTTMKYEEAMREERIRMDEANEQALKEARLEAEALAAKLEKQDEEYANAIAEAARDAHANRVCLGADSVRRLKVD